MQLLAIKILTTSLLVMGRLAAIIQVCLVLTEGFPLHSLLFGYAPLLLSQRYDLASLNSGAQQPLVGGLSSGRGGRALLASLLSLGGGVLLANSFCHWLPEVREGLQSVDT